MSDWWYVEKHKKTGPVTEDDLRRLIKAGKIDLNTMIWKEGMELWQQINETESLICLGHNWGRPSYIHI